MSDRCPGHEPCAQAEEAPDGALWRSLEEREGGAESRAARQREFPAGASTPPPTPDASAAVSRRRFLSLVAASAALGAAGCSTPHDRGRMVPYTRKPEEVLPGVANYYATAFAEGPHVYPLLVKAREGRPIHITGNDAHPESRGKTTLRAQAEVLALYDPDRLREPTENGRRIRPEAATEKLVAALREAGERGSRALLLTGASTSPTRRALIEELTRAVPHLSHVAFEPAGDHAARAAALALYGRADLPTPRLDRARVVLAVEADFVSSLPDSARMLREFSETRRVRNRGDAMSRLYAVEGRLSLTGGNADHRLPLRPSRAAAFLFGLARELARRPGASLPPGADAAALADFDLWALCEREGLERGVVQALLADLADHRGAALVLCGPTLPTSAHVAAATLNHMLGAEGTTLDTSAMLPASACATPEEMQGLFSDLQAGRYAVVIFWESNPVHALPNGAAWRAALAGVPTRVFLGTLANETSEECGLLLPVSHWLESWGDYETAGGALTLAQPLIEPLYETRQAEEWLLAWLSALGGQQPGQYYDFLRERWQREYYPSDSPVPFNAFWNGAVHDGFLARTRPAEERIPRAPAIAAAAEAARPASDPGLELTLHPDARFWDGRHANNGWLAELPDPVSKQAWGNSLAVSPADAARLGLSDGDLVELRVEGQSLRAPALVQPGQAPGVLSLALGFGRSTGSVATGVGINAYPLVAAAARAPYLRAGVSIEKTGRRGRLIRTQDHWSLEGRDEDILRRMTLADYAQGHAPHAHAHELYTLYPEHASQEHKWGMAIDLAACVGC